MAGDLSVVVKIIKAELFRSFDTIGKMDPFCKVLWQSADGSKWELTRTRTDWQAHMHPQWNHTSRAQPYSMQGKDSVSFEVSEENFGGYGIPTFCGSVTISVSELLSGATAPAGGRQISQASAQDLALVKRGEHTGNLTVQAILVRAGAECESCREACAGVHIESNMFVEPANQISVAGGTAPFFSLQLRDGLDGSPKSKSHYIGKDLSHATDEVDFYEDVLKLQRTPGEGGLGPLTDFMFEYAGLLTTPVLDCEGNKSTKELLVMQNLYDGCKSLRLLDIKIGQQTAVAGWQGKSKMAALRNGFVDSLTNSTSEGFRLEGFGGAPPALKTMDPLLDIKDWGIEDSSEKTKQKALRLMLQRMHGTEMFMHFYDVHQSTAEPGNAALHVNRSPMEVVELVSYEVAKRLVKLAFACRRSPVPQKWVGSSVALGFDCGSIRSRKETDKQLRSTVKVNIFDWGRSQLNTIDKHVQLLKEERQDRAKFWSNYVAGIDHLAWEAVRAYWHRFDHHGAWSQLEITVYDFDSMSDNDFIGSISIPLEETPEKTVRLADSKGRISDSNGGAGSLTYAIERQSYTGFEGSRFKEVWRIHIICAANLPKLDRIQGKSDPFVVVKAFDENRKHCFRQQTSTIVHDLNPHWAETFELPILSRPGQLSHCLENMHFELQEGFLDSMLPPVLSLGDSQIEEALSKWRLQLDQAEKVQSEHIMTV